MTFENASDAWLEGDGRRQDRLRIAIVGAGHVGLTTAVCLAALGHRVRVLDVDTAKIAALSAGHVPFLEPGLGTLLDAGLTRGALRIDEDAAAVVPGAQVVFVCVDTPNYPDGRVDLRSVEAAACEVIRLAAPGTVLVNRSTSPVGTGSYLRSLAEERRPGELAVAVNPEFLAEGTAVRDFLVPDRIVIGAWEQAAVDLLLRAYDPIVRRQLPADLPAGLLAPRAAGQPVPVVVCDPPTAEVAKYAANAFLAVKISFINEIASIAEEVAADVVAVSEAVGLDRRIGPSFLRAGVGWGGSCFPKDIVALQGMAETRGLSARLLRAANEVNAEQREWVIRSLQRHLHTLVGRRVGLLGLAFKPHTDDLRSAPSLEIAVRLARLGARVRAFDPAIRSVPPDVGEALEPVDDPFELAEGAEAIVLVTEWPEFRTLDLDRLRAKVRYPLLLDGRNFLDPAAAQAAGFRYVGVGRQALGRPEPALADVLPSPA